MTDPLHPLAGAPRLSNLPFEGEGGIPSLRLRLIDRIRRDGPIRIDDYMRACLHDPSDGYYAVRPGLGAGADFVTSPYVSQMFGELLGSWAVETWRQLERPKGVRLVELGPGDGVMMSDVLRGAGIAPDFLDAIEIVLVETSAPLISRQRAALAGHAPRWVSSIDEIGEGAPMIVLANEFLDCLPIRQAVRAADGWRERRIGADEAGRFEFTVGEPAAGPSSDAPPGSVFEWSSDLSGMGEAMGGLMAKAGGASLFIDYGRGAPGFGNTLQAVRDHRKVDPLFSPGFADLSAHVDFPVFLAAASAGGGAVPPLLSQAELLSRLGVKLRARALARANPHAAEMIGRQLARLTAPDQMGVLFKAACVAAPELPIPGFDAIRHDAT